MGESTAEGAAGALHRKVHPGTLDCVHCGLCLSSCPTYVATGREDASPRGRIYLMRGVAEGRIEMDSVVDDAISLCLGCRACESACPSGVEYGALLEGTRAELRRAGVRRGIGAKIEALLLRHLLPHPWRLHAVVSLLAFAQRLGLDRLARRLAPRGLEASLAQAPLVPPAALRVPLPRFTPARGPRRGHVALLEGCVMRQLFGRVNRATVELLALNGFDVSVPARQGCCGALAAHAGLMGEAMDRAYVNVRAFAGDFDAILTNSAGCGAALRAVSHWIGTDARKFESRVQDVCEFLDAQGMRLPRRGEPMRVCYDDPCHLIHGQGVEAAPRRLLAQIPGLELVPHADPTRCCGAAGTYGITQPEMSEQVLAAKLDSLEAARPDVIATGNPGCMMQIERGVRGRGLPARVVHPVELLLDAC